MACRVHHKRATRIWVMGFPSALVASGAARPDSTQQRQRSRSVFVVVCRAGPHHTRFEGIRSIPPCLP
jgi:hypothetical protein